MVWVVSHQLVTTEAQILQSQGNDLWWISGMGKVFLQATVFPSVLYNH